MLKHPRCVALGEIGLDAFHAQSLEDQDRQLDALHALCKVAASTPKPVVFHCRAEGEVDPFDSLLQVAKQYLPGNKKVHFHCFSGSYMQALRWLHRFPNTKFGFTGMVTKDPSLLKVAGQLGITYLLLETDAPYLLPAGCVGPNHPWNLVYVAEALAGELKCSLAEVLRVTRLSSYELYGLPWP